VATVLVRRLNIAVDRVLPIATLQKNSACRNRSPAQWVMRKAHRLWTLPRSIANPPKTPPPSYSSYPPRTSPSKFAPVTSMTRCQEPPAMGIPSNRITMWIARLKLGGGPRPPFHSTPTRSTSLSSTATWRSESSGPRTRPTSGLPSTNCQQNRLCLHQCFSQKGQFLSLIAASLICRYNLTLDHPDDGNIKIRTCRTGLGCTGDAKQWNSFKDCDREIGSKQTISLKFEQKVAYILFYNTKTKQEEELWRPKTGPWPASYTLKE